MFFRIVCVAMRRFSSIAGASSAPGPGSFADQCFPIRATNSSASARPTWSGAGRIPKPFAAACTTMRPPRVEDTDLREALLRGISETGVPTIETDWVPPSKQSEIGATFTKIAKPTLQCMFEPRPEAARLGLKLSVVKTQPAAVSTRPAAATIIALYQLNRRAISLARGRNQCNQAKSCVVMRGACRVGVSCHGRSRRAAIGQGGRLSDRQPRQLVLRRERAGRIVQQSRQASCRITR